jgi:ferrochelatase
MNKPTLSVPGAQSVASPVSLPPDHPPVKTGRVGVLLTNLGTPEGTDFWNMRRYLKEFLSDRRVIEVWRPLWWTILNLFVLTTRPSKSGHAYSIVWDKERNEGPLVRITRSQAEKLGVALAKVDGRITVDWAMRYGAPSVASRIEAL